MVEECQKPIRLQTKFKEINKLVFMKVGIHGKKKAKKK